MTNEQHARTSDELSVVVEPFDRARHDARSFSCGKATLDTYIQDTVERDSLERTAVAYVLVNQADQTPVRRVIGYFTLSGYGFSKRQARRRDRDRFLGAYDPVPAILVGRLALDSAYQGFGLGKDLLVAALSKALETSGHLGAAVVVVHALDDDAASFYEYLGFTHFREVAGHLYFPLATFVQGLQADE